MIPLQLHARIVRPRKLRPLRIPPPRHDALPHRRKVQQALLLEGQPNGGGVLRKSAWTRPHRIPSGSRPSNHRLRIKRVLKTPKSPVGSQTPRASDRSRRAPKLAFHRLPWLPAPVEVNRRRSKRASIQLDRLQMRLDAPSRSHPKPNPRPRSKLRRSPNRVRDSPRNLRNLSPWPSPSPRQELREVDSHEILKTIPLRASDPHLRPR